MWSIWNRGERSWGNEDVRSGDKAQRLFSATCGTAEAVPFQNFGHSVVFPQPVKPSIDLIGFIGTRPRPEPDPEGSPVPRWGTEKKLLQPVPPGRDFIGGMRTPDFMRGYYQLLPPGGTGQRVSSIRGSATLVEDCCKRFEN